jgi:hypothetical protein
MTCSLQKQDKQVGIMQATEGTQPAVKSLKEAVTSLT